MESQFSLAQGSQSKALFDYIADGDTVDAFLSDFPGVTHEQVQQCLIRASASFDDKDEAAA